MGPLRAPRTSNCERVMEQKRFILAMSLITVVFIVWQAVMGPGPSDTLPKGSEPVAEEGAQAPTTGEGAQVAAGQTGEGEPDRVLPAAEPGDEPVVAPTIAERSDVLANDSLRVTLNNQGAVATDIQVMSPEQYAGE